MTEHQKLALSALHAAGEALKSGDPDSSLEYMAVAAVALTDPSMRAGKAVLYVTADAEAAVKSMDIDAVAS